MCLQRILRIRIRERSNTTSCYSTGDDKDQARKRTAHTALQLRVVELSRVTITWPCCFFPHSSFCPTQPRVQPNTERMQRGPRGDQATENARYTTPRSEWKNALGTNVVRVWRSPWDVERAPRKLGWWDAKRVDESGRCDSRRRLSTSHSSLIYIPKFVHFDDEAWSVWGMKEGWDVAHNEDIPEWKTGLANPMCPKWPGHSDILSPHVWHLKFRSWCPMPMRGSISPLILDLWVASSVTFGCSILATEMAFCDVRVNIRGIYWRWKRSHARSLPEKEYPTEVPSLCGSEPPNTRTGGRAWFLTIQRLNTELEATKVRNDAWIENALCRSSWALASTLMEASPSCQRRAEKKKREKPRPGSDFGGQKVDGENVRGD